MLDYTTAAFRKIITDVKNVRLIFELFTQLFMVIYLVYSLFTNSNLRITNGILLALTLAYLCFWLQITKNGLTKDEKKLKNRVKKIFKYIKLGFGFFTLGFAVYGVYTNMQTVDFFSLLITVFTVVSFIIKILLLLLEYIANYYKELIRTAVEADVENALKPVHAVGNFTKKLFGKEKEEPADPTKERQILDKLVEEKRQENQAKKEEKKQQKRQEKQEAKLYKAQVKEEKRLQKQADKQAEQETALDEVAVTETPALPPVEETNEPQTEQAEPPTKKPWWKFGKKDNTNA